MDGEFDAFLLTGLFASKVGLSADLFGVDAPSFPVRLDAAGELGPPLVLVSPVGWRLGTEELDEVLGRRRWRLFRRVLGYGW